MSDGDNFLNQHLEYIGKYLYGTLGTYTHWTQAALESGAHFTFHENHNDSNNCVCQHDTYANYYTFYEHCQFFRHK